MAKGADAESLSWGRAGQCIISQYFYRELKRGVSRLTIGDSSIMTIIVKTNHVPHEIYYPKMCHITKYLSILCKLNYLTKYIFFSDEFNKTSVIIICHLTPFQVIFVFIFRYLELELLTQFPALNNEK